MKNHDELENLMHLVGWLLFVLCAIFFIASSLKNHDSLALIGSVVFLVSCIVFIVPLVVKIKNTEDKRIKSHTKANSSEVKSHTAD